MGTYRMNIYTVRHATQAFAQVILAEGPEAVKRGVAVCCDCRNHSDEFARAAAQVLAHKGLRLLTGPHHIAGPPLFLCLIQNTVCLLQQMGHLSLTRRRSNPVSSISCPSARRAFGAPWEWALTG